VPENIGKVQSRHADFSIRKVQPRHVSRFPIVWLNVKNQNKISQLFFSKSGFRQQNWDMCQENIGKMQSRHAEPMVGKVQSQHVTRRGGTIFIVIGPPES